MPSQWKIILMRRETFCKSVQLSHYHLNKDISVYRPVELDKNGIVLFDFLGKFSTKLNFYTSIEINGVVANSFNWTVIISNSQKKSIYFFWSKLWRIVLFEQWSPQILKYHFFWWTGYSNTFFIGRNINNLGINYTKQAVAERKERSYGPPKWWYVVNICLW